MTVSNTKNASSSGGATLLAPKRLVPVELGLTAALVVAIVVMSVASLVLVSFLGFKRVIPVAVDGAGRVLPIITLEQPHLPDNRVLGFVDECLRRSFAHDFENFRTTVNDAKRCYTPNGASEFALAIEPLLADLQRLNMVMSVSLQTSVMHNKYIREGLHVWEVQTPMTLYRRGSREAIAPAEFLVTTTVIRVPLEQEVRGIALRAINMRPMRR